DPWDQSLTTWRSSFGAPLKHLVTERAIQRAFGVYLGSTPLKDGSLDVLPLFRFLDQLYEGAILGLRWASISCVRCLVDLFAIRVDGNRNIRKPRSRNSRDGNSWRRNPGRRHPRYGTYQA